MGWDGIVPIVDGDVMGEGDGYISLRVYVAGKGCIVFSMWLDICMRGIVRDCEGKEGGGDDAKMGAKRMKWIGGWDFC